MGVKIHGKCLGLGVDLFSGKKTVAEEIGLDRLDRELRKQSRYFREKSCSAICRGLLSQRRFLRMQSVSTKHYSLFCKILPYFQIVVKSIDFFEKLT